MIVFDELAIKAERLALECYDAVNESNIRTQEGQGLLELALEIRQAVRYATSHMKRVAL